MAELASLIEAHPFWKGLTINLGERLAGAAKQIAFAPGALVFKEGDPAQHLHLLYRGRIVLEADIPVKGPTTFRTLEPGEAIGWSWLLPPHRWQFTAKAVTSTEIVLIEAQAVRSLADEQPAFGRELVNRMAEVLVMRLEMSREKLRELHASAHARQQDSTTDAG